MLWVKSHFVHASMYRCTIAHADRVHETYCLFYFLSVRFCGIHLRATLQRVPKLLYSIISLKITLLKLLPWLLGPNELTHWGLVTPYGDIDLGQHLAQVMACCLMAPSHYLKSWTNVDLSSVRPSDILLRSILQGIPQPTFPSISLKITYLKLN